MKHKTGLVLLSWSALSAMLTLYAFVFATGSQGLVDKSLVPQMVTLVEGGALDEAKLKARCKEEFRDAPERDLRGGYGPWSLAHWMGAGTCHMVSQAVSLLAWGLAAGTVITAACGISCMRSAPKP